MIRARAGFMADLRAALELVGGLASLAVAAALMLALRPAGIAVLAILALGLVLT